ncbi:MAG: hypothetical protein QXX07_00575 [Candidatus Aenigmatarchaeota archaeon]
MLVPFSEKECVTFKTKRILFPDKILKFLKKLERKRYSIEIFYNSKKISLDEFEKMIKTQDYNQDFLTFSAKRFDGNYVSGYALYFLFSPEGIENFYSSGFTLKGNWVELLELLLESLG